jgi:hypothetical protein
MLKAEVMDQETGRRRGTVTADGDDVTFTKQVEFLSDVIRVEDDLARRIDWGNQQILIRELRSTEEQT